MVRGGIHQPAHAGCQPFGHRHPRQPRGQRYILEALLARAVPIGRSILVVRLRSHARCHDGCLYSLHSRVRTVQLAQSRPGSLDQNLEDRHDPRTGLVSERRACQQHHRPNCAAAVIRAVRGCHGAFGAQPLLCACFRGRRDPPHRGWGRSSALLSCQRSAQHRQRHQGLQLRRSLRSAATR